MDSEHKLPLFISYFTPNTHYETRAKQLKRSLDELGLENVISGLPSRGSWLANCAQKAEFVASVWEKSERAVCWVDADAVLLRQPHQLENFVADFAVVARGGWNFFGGQVVFGKSALAGELLNRWLGYCQTYPHIWDQVSLGYAWWDQMLADGCDTLWLPNSIMTKGSANDAIRYLQTTMSKAAFCHLQESRRSRETKKPRTYSQSGEGEFRPKFLPDWWRKAAIARKPFELTTAQRRELGLVVPRATAVKI